MPYIKTEGRDTLDKLIRQFGPMSAGELNYCMTRLCSRFLASRMNYEGIALVTGVIENVKQELYRRIASNYEDQKMAENGDVY